MGWQVRRQGKRGCCSRDKTAKALFGYLLFSGLPSYGLPAGWLKRPPLVIPHSFYGGGRVSAQPHQTGGGGK